jgi:hypothetical protein
MKIISVSGFIASGKDTVAEYLVQQKGFRRESFASTLKDAICCVFGWDRIMLEGNTTESRQWREQVDQWWADRLNMPHLTPRWVMQYWGTEVCRQGFHDDIWIASLEKRLQESDSSIVISDARFPNELSMLKRINATTVWVKRHPFPDWYYHAASANQGCEIAREKLKELGIHASETSWIGHKFDHEIDNDFTLAYLYQCIDSLLADH